MAITVKCDYCGKPIPEVAYTIAVNGVYPDGLRPIAGTYHLHYDCIVPWRERDK